MSLLRGIIHRLSGRDRAPVTESPPRTVGEIFSRMRADIEQLGEDDDLSQVLDRTRREVRELQRRMPPAPEKQALFDRFVERLSSVDKEILQHYRRGKTYREIGSLMGVEAEAVRDSLGRTLVELRMWMGPSTNPDGHDDRQGVMKAPPPVAAIGRAKVA